MRWSDYHYNIDKRQRSAGALKKAGQTMQCKISFPNLPAIWVSFPDWQRQLAAGTARIIDRGSGDACYVLRQTESGAIVAIKAIIYYPKPQLQLVN